MATRYFFSDFILCDSTIHSPLAEQERHLAAVENAINEQGTLTHSNVHGVILGLARSGKDSLMRRLLGEPLTGKSPSTGVAEGAIQVIVEKSSSRTILATVEKLKWKRLKRDDEALETMTQLTTKRVSTPISCYEETHKTSVKNSGTVEEPDVGVHTHTLKKGGKCSTSENITKLCNLREEHSSSFILSSVPTSKHQMEKHNTIRNKPLSVFKNALKSGGLEHFREYLENHWTLYLSNTGGQIEFQELLPFLVSGPSLFFVTFRLDQDLDKYYEIEYSVIDDASEQNSSSHQFKYTASTTQLENILRTLASVSAVVSYNYSCRHQENLNYKVFIIGTHLDILENSLSPDDVQKRIREIDHTIQVATCKFRESNKTIWFATRDQLIFTVNNFSIDDHDFQHIRSSVQELVDRGCFETKYASRWLIYNVILRLEMKPITHYDTCFDIAKECGIHTSEEHKDALHFMHTKTSTIRYFPVDELKTLVFSDPNVLFSKVTELIFQTFTFDQVNKQPMDEFKKKGIFTFRDYEEHCAKIDPNSPLTPSMFMKLLDHLRIAAPFNEGEVKKYFLPCALSHVSEQQNESTDNVLPPLVISFECGYCPMGVGYALVKYLITNEMNSDNEWRFLPCKVFRNEVSFEVEPTLDIVTLKIKSTHLEIQLLCDGITDPGDPDISATCTKVCRTIETGLKMVTADMGYAKNTKISFTFYCNAQECKVLERARHPATLARSENNKPKNLVCRIDNERHCSDLPKGWKCWLSATSLSHVQCKPCHFTILYEQLSKYAYKWGDIGACLGFTHDELKNIQACPNISAGGPKDFLQILLNKWLQWAPGDHRGSTNHAMLEALKDAVSKAELGFTATRLTLQYPVKE